MSRDKIERSFADAGWDIDRSFSGYLVIGYSGDLSLLAYDEAWETEDGIFELIDHERLVTCRVHATPTPREAAALLHENGLLLEE